MNNLDVSLRRALMDANLLQFETVLKNAGSAEPDFSPRYRRDRLRLLADPFGWMKRQGRAAWKKVLRTAACVLLSCTLTLGSLMAVSPTVRAAVLHWLREIGGGLMTYSTVRPGALEYLPSHWRPTWLPEGWTLQSMTRNLWKYWEADGQGRLLYACYSPDAHQMTTNVDGTADAEALRSTVRIQGYSADYYRSELSRVLIWENQEGYLFMLRGTAFPEEEAFLKIAESIAPYEEPNTAWKMGWVPPEYEPLYRDELIGAAEELWTHNGVSLLWQYVTDPLCPFMTPAGEPELIDLGDGRTARFWAPEAPMPESGGEPSEGGSTIEIGGIRITTSSGAGSDAVGTLLWTDPDTNTAFLLEGPLERGDLLRMARSVTAAEPDPSKPFGNSQIISGTAYGG